MIIKSNSPSIKITISTTVNSEILNKIYQYCQWSNIDNISLFIEKAAQFYLEDKHKNNLLDQPTLRKNNG